MTKYPRAINGIIYVESAKIPENINFESIVVVKAKLNIPISDLSLIKGGQKLRIEVINITSYENILMNGNVISIVKSSDNYFDFSFSLTPKQFKDSVKNVFNSGMSYRVKIFLDEVSLSDRLLNSLERF